MSETRRVGGVLLTDHEFELPLDHGRQGGETISVFAREVADPEKTSAPMLVFFQGGPGSEAPRPIPPLGGMMARALKEFRVLLLDQRGTGRSTPVGTLPEKSPQEQAEYLTHFRADSIVRDAELIRGKMGIEQWSVLGQSFGGFCVMSYLSLFPESLAGAFVTGGLAPIGRPVDDVYRKTYDRTIERSRRYYQRYPEDRDRVLRLVERLDGEDVRLPSGDRLTSRRFRQLGQVLGMSDGAERLHYLLELSPDSPAFRHDVDRSNPFSRNPIYAIIHEACYADGVATRWAADRVQPEIYETEPEIFMGEHVFPWMFEDIGYLEPLREAAMILAEVEWPRLYDADVLGRNAVPAAAAVYFEDMYVESEYSIETAHEIKGIRPWITNEYDHDGLRKDGERVLDRLIKLSRGDA